MRYIFLFVLIAIGISIFNYYPKYQSQKEQEKIHQLLKQGVFSDTESVLVSNEIQSYVNVEKDIDYPNASFNIRIKDGQQTLKVDQPEQLSGQIALDLCHDFNTKFLYPMIDKAPQLKEVLQHDNIQIHYQIVSPSKAVIVDNTFNPLSCLNN